MKSIYQNFTIAVCTLTVGAGMVLGGTPSAKNRQKVQQKRIEQGVENNSLTKAEALRLERNAAKIHRQTMRDRKDGGVFTPRERAKAQHRLNKQSKAIAKQKHDRQRR